MTDSTMGNQQGRTATELELAWLAGMLNGDGCFSIKFRVRGGTVKCDLSLTLTQCDPCLIERTMEIMMTFGLNPSIVEYEPSGAGIRTKYNLRINKMAHIRTTLEAIIPYMVGEKLAQARLMKRYIDRRFEFTDPSRRRANPIADDAVALGIASEFYAVRNQEFPSDVVKALNDYPAREYGQAAGSTRHPKG